MKIYSASFEHADAIAALHALSWSQTYNDVMTPTYLHTVVPIERQSVWRQRLIAPKENQVVLIAEQDGALIGFACAFIGEHANWGSYLDNLHVSASHQGQGVGAGLLNEIASFCAQQCPQRGFYLLVNQSNLRAQRFYLSLGAENAGADIWDAPDGSQIPTYRFAWSSLDLWPVSRPTLR
jgi:ribosomal protein S18 acetylase RimI-like enzyme